MSVRETAFKPKFSKTELHPAEATPKSFTYMGLSQTCAVTHPFRLPATDVEVVAASRSSCKIDRTIAAPRSIYFHPQERETGKLLIWKARTNRRRFVSFQLPRDGTSRSTVHIRSRPNILAAFSSRPKGRTVCRAICWTVLVLPVVTSLRFANLRIAFRA